MAKASARGGERIRRRCKWGFHKEYEDEGRIEGMTYFWKMRCKACPWYENRSEYLGEERID